MFLLSFVPTVSGGLKYPQIHIVVSMFYASVHEKQTESMIATAGFTFSL